MTQRGTDVSESREKRDEKRVLQKRIRAHPRPLTTAEYLRNGSGKNVHRRAGKVKERVRSSAAREREREREKRCARSKEARTEEEGEE